MVWGNGDVGDRRGGVGDVKDCGDDAGGEDAETAAQVCLLLLCSVP